MNTAILVIVSFLAGGVAGTTWCVVCRSSVARSARSDGLAGVERPTAW
jgi:uncharacterized membrane protein